MDVVHDFGGVVDDVGGDSEDGDIRVQASSEDSARTLPTVNYNTLVIVGDAFASACNTPFLDDIPSRFPPVDHQHDEKIALAPQLMESCRSACAKLGDLFGVLQDSLCLHQKGVKRHW